MTPTMKPRNADSLKYGHLDKQDTISRSQKTYVDNALVTTPLNCVHHRYSVTWGDYANSARLLKACRRVGQAMMRVAGHKVFLFDKGDSLIGEPVSPLSLRVSNVDPTIATIVSSSKQYLYTTTDAGDSWRRGKLPTASFSPESDIFLSHRLANTLALLSTAGELYITYNLGTSWSRLATAIDMTAFKFNIDGRFLYVSRQNYTGKLGDSTTRRLYVSSNYDASDASKVHFTQVQLPSLKPQELFVVMATHEAGAFIHVSDNAGVSFGRFYMSDSSGARFSLSLDNHLVSPMFITDTPPPPPQYHVMDSDVGVMSVDDF
eukprot:Em0001g3787a